MKVGVYSTSTLLSTFFAAGDVVSLLVEASDGQARTSLAATPVTILIAPNTAPTTPVIAVTPASPQAGDSLMCTETTVSTDADGDPITYTYVGEKDGTQSGTETSTMLTSVVDGGNVLAGESWTCRVVASDGRGATSSAAESSVVVRGAAPTGFMVIPEGTFTQGDSNWETRQVTISRSFYLQATDATQKQWRDVIANNANPSYFSGCDDCPVEQVSWWDALAYMNRLSQ